MNLCGGRRLHLCILLTVAYLFSPAQAASSHACKAAHPDLRPPIFDAFEYDTRPERFSIQLIDPNDSSDPRQHIHPGWATHDSEWFELPSNTGLEKWGDLPYFLMRRTRLDGSNLTNGSAPSVREFLKLLEGRYMGSDGHMNYVLGRDSVYQAYDQNEDWKNQVPRFQQQDLETRGQVLVFGFQPTTQRLLEIRQMKSDLTPAETLLMKKFGWHSANEFFATAQVSVSTDPAHLLNVEKEFPDSLSLDRKPNQVWVELGRGFNKAIADLDPETQETIRQQGGAERLSKMILFHQLLAVDYDFAADFMVAEVNDARLRQIQVQLRMKPRILTSRDTGAKDKRNKPIFDHVIIFDKQEIHAVVTSLLLEFIQYKAEASLKQGRGILWPVSKPYIRYIQELGIFSFLQAHGYNTTQLKMENSISHIDIPIPKHLLNELIQFLRPSDEGAERGTLKESPPG